MRRECKEILFHIFDHSRNRLNYLILQTLKLPEEDYGLFTLNSPLDRNHNQVEYVPTTNLAY
jgi:hypothetical protein